MRITNGCYVSEYNSLKETISFGRKDIYSKLPVATRWAEWKWVGPYGPSGGRTKLMELYLICA